MAWIPKPSATTEIERRTEPYLTQAMQDELSQRYLPRFETTLAALLPALHMIQHEYHWVPPQAMEEIAGFLDLSPADVMDTASFYEEYALAPRGRHVVGVCRSIACEFCGQPEVTQAIKEALDIDVGESTDDDKLCLIELECLGSCGTAPVALIDEQLHEQLTPERAAELVRQVRASDSVPAGTGREGLSPEAVSIVD
ncbi:MAG: NAD(P)H-dependent oxidoreductase subunit E [Phycisphaera sp.]|nr:MAG: NAD(P)H-dependent oxidoreductase subunit E [Phycisphaera sp.]